MDSWSPLAVAYGLFACRLGLRASRTVVWRFRGKIPMNRRVQPGDIAITVNTDLPNNASLLVEVLAVKVVDPFWGDRRGRLSRVRSAGGRPIHTNSLTDGKWRRQVPQRVTEYRVVRLAARSGRPHRGLAHPLQRRPTTQQPRLLYPDEFKQQHPPKPNWPSSRD